MKLVKSSKVQPLYRKKATVQNILKDTYARNEYTKVLIVGVDKDGYMYHAYSHMKMLEAIGMAEYAKSAIIKRMCEES